MMTQQHHNTKGSQGHLQLYLRLYDGNGCMLQVPKRASVCQLKENVCDSKLPIPSLFRLIYSGKELNNPSAILTDLDIKNGSIIHVQSTTPESKKQLKINVDIYYNKQTFMVRVSTDETILSLKKRLQKLVGCLPFCMKIVFRGEYLTNDKKISEYHIKSNSLLCLIVQRSNSLPLDLQVGNFYIEDNLIDSCVSVRNNTPETYTKTSAQQALFRSEMPFASGKSIQAFELEIKEPQEKLDDFLESGKQFQFNLFGSFQENLLPKSYPIYFGQHEKNNGKMHIQERPTKEGLQILSQESIEYDDISFSQRVMKI